MRIGDWSSDVCSSGLGDALFGGGAREPARPRTFGGLVRRDREMAAGGGGVGQSDADDADRRPPTRRSDDDAARGEFGTAVDERKGRCRSEEHTSELQSLTRNSYAVIRFKKKII